MAWFLVLFFVMIGVLTWIFLNAGVFIGAGVLGRYMLRVISDFVLLFLDGAIFFSLGSVLGFDRYEELVVFSLPD